MEEDIEILEKFAKTTILYGGRLGLVDSQFEKIKQAIENVLNRLKELEEENKNSIGKDRIRKYIKTLEDKLKEYKVNMGGKEYIDMSYLDKKEKELVNNIIVQIATLKDLLEEE